MKDLVEATPCHSDSPQPIQSFYSFKHRTIHERAAFVPFNDRLYGLHVDSSSLYLNEYYSNDLHRRPLFLDLNTLVFDKGHLCSLLDTCFL